MNLRAHPLFGSNHLPVDLLPVGLPVMEIDDVFDELAELRNGKQKANVVAEEDVLFGRVFRELGFGHRSDVSLHWLASTGPICRKAEEQAEENRYDFRSAPVSVPDGRCRLDGCNAFTTQVVLSETGVDMGRWRTCMHFSAGWALTMTFSGGKVLI